MITKNFLSSEEMKKTFHMKRSFAELIKTHRLCEEKSQVDYARLLHMTPQTLCDLEKGRRIPTPKRAFQIAKKIGVLPEYAVELVLNDALKKQHLDFLVSITHKKRAS